MNKSIVARKVVVLASGGATMWLVLQIVFILGVEKKSTFQIFWDMIGGGAGGAALGLFFFLTFGAIGWVSGALYGAFGLVSLMLGGALGGMGLGSIIHVARNPSHYEFNWMVIFIGIVFGYFSVRWATRKVGDLYDRYGPSLMQKYIAPSVPPDA